MSLARIISSDALRLSSGSGRRSSPFSSIRSNSAGAGRAARRPTRPKIERVRAELALDLANAKLPSSSLTRELLPKAELVALLINPTSPVAEPQTRDAQAAASALGFKLTILNAVAENDFDQVFATLVQQRADALLISADPFFTSRREHLVALAARHAIPTFYEIREFVEAGGLMSYGAVLREGYYKGGIYSGRVLKGVPLKADRRLSRLE
jgi:hypothetical protein